MSQIQERISSVLGSESQITANSFNPKLLPISPLPIHKNFGSAGVFGFALSGLGPMTAVLFTNPADVAKVRMQMPGLNYSGMADCMRKTFDKEGFSGLNAGLKGAIIREGSKNVFRIGLFQPLLNQIHDPNSGPAPVWKRLVCGGCSGGIAAVVCNPIEIAKTRLQMGSVMPERPQYRGVYDALSTITRTDGLASLWAGTPTNAMRSILITSTNLTVQSVAKERAISSGLMQQGYLLTSLTALLGAFVAQVIASPVDVIRTRLYNDNPAKPAYSGLMDCGQKIVAADGALGLYAGFNGAFLRMGPHFVLVFLFIDMYKNVSKGKLMEHHERQQLVQAKQIFSFFDMDQNGKIDKDEAYMAMKKMVPRSSRPFLSDLEYQKEIRKVSDECFVAEECKVSGGIDFPRFVNYMKKLRDAERDQTIHATFNSIAKNSPGDYITQKDLASMFRGMMLEDRNSWISEDQFETQLNKDTLDLVTKIGDPNTHQITFDDFKQICGGMEIIQRSRVIEEWREKAGVGIS